MGGFRDWLKRQGPAWLRGTNGKALSGEMGGELDYQQGRLLNGLLARFPTKGSVDSDGRYGLAPADALDQQGEDRGMRRGPGESDSAYAARLWGAWDYLPYLGSHWGVLQSLRIAGYDDPIIVQDNGRWARLTGSAGTIADMTLGNLMTCKDRAGEPGWQSDIDARTDFYARFSIIFEADQPGVLDDESGQAILVDIVNTWKPSNKVFECAAVILTGQLLGWPTGRTCGTDANLGGNSVRIIPGDGSAPYVKGP